MNAIDALKGVATKKVTLSLRRIEDESHIGILDSGEGLKEEDLEKIFQPFFSTKESESHPGLGLTAAQKAANDLGGFIDVDQNVSSGTMFNLVVPLVRNESQDEAVHNHEVGKALTAEENLPLKGMTNQALSPKQCLFTI